MSPELVEKAYWLYQEMQRDDDVKAGFMSVMAHRGYDSMDEFADTDPDGFCGVVEALQDMVEQVPAEQLRSAGTGKEEE